MDAMKRITDTLTAIPQTPEEKRRAKNRRYYERNREIWRWFNEIKKLRALRDLLMEPTHANH